jgi:XTP/dITP diphosphohydrolase
MIKTIIASGNAHKLEEFKLLLSGTEFKLVSANSFGGMPSVEESGVTFRENAFIKASALKAMVPSDYGVLSDDSGLEVDHLQGAPGVYSARYAGANATDGENVEKLLDALQDVPNNLRTARFRCVLCWLDETGVAHYFEGTCEGRIQEQARGVSGFGYDPIFVPQGYEQSFGELGESIKSEMSHRALALRQFRNTFVN